MKKYYAYGVDKLFDGKTVDWQELHCRYSDQKSFYGKAYVWTTDKGVRCLQSYESTVAVVLPNGRYLSGGYYSQTTSKHQKEFYKQFAKFGSLDDCVNYSLLNFWI